jgi:hypothetical protein
MRKSRSRVVASPDGLADERPDHPLMTKRTYAVSWKEDGGEAFAGRLDLALTHVRLEGRSAAGNEVLRVFHYGDLSGISAERHNGHREIVLGWYGRRLWISVINGDGAGAFAELLEQLRDRAESPHTEADAAASRPA